MLQFRMGKRALVSLSSKFILHISRQKFGKFCIVGMPPLIWDSRCW